MNVSRQPEVSRPIATEALAVQANIREGVVQSVGSHTITRRPNPLMIFLIRFLAPGIGLIFAIWIIGILLTNMFSWIRPFLGIAFLFLIIASAFQVMGGRMNIGDGIGWAVSSLFRGIGGLLMFVWRTLAQLFQSVATQITAPAAQNRQLTVWDIVCAGDNYDVFSIQITGDVLSGGVPSVGHRVRVEGVPASPRRLWNLTTNAEVTWRRPAILGL